MTAAGIAETSEESGTLHRAIDWKGAFWVASGSPRTDVQVPPRGPTAAGASPGNVRNFAAMLPAGYAPSM